MNDKLIVQESQLNQIGFPPIYFIGQLYHDLATDKIYRATNLSASGWVEFTIGGGGGNVQDMQVAWEPTTLKLGEMLGFHTYADLPGITKIQFLGTTSIAGFDIEGMNDLVELDFPNLVSVDPTNTQSGYINIGPAPNLSMIDIHNLTFVAGQIAIAGTNLSIVNLQNLVTVGNLGISNASLLTSIDVSSWIPTDGTFINMNLCALDATSVELILRRCVLAGVTTCTISIDGGTNTGLAALSVQGQADYATLVTAGNTITLNA